MNRILLRGGAIVAKGPGVCQIIAIGICRGVGKGYFPSFHLAGKFGNRRGVLPVLHLKVNSLLGNVNAVRHFKSGINLPGSRKGMCSILILDNSAVGQDPSEAQQIILITVC